MATRTKPLEQVQPTDPDPDPELDEEEAPVDPKAVKRYIVQSDCVTVPVGRRENGKLKHARVLFGGIVHGAHGSATIEHLVALGAIREVKNATEAAQYRDPRYRLTVREAAQLAGAPDDPVKQPNPDFEPIPAPASGSQPGRTGDPDISLDVPDLPTE